MSSTSHLPFADSTLLMGHVYIQHLEGATLYKHIKFLIFVFCKKYIFVIFIKNVNCFINKTTLIN